MFYFDTIKSDTKNIKILKSTVLDKFQENFKYLFTTKESFIKTGEKDLQNTIEANKTMVLDYLNINNEDIFEIKQTHTSNIKICENTPNFADETDGVILKNANNATILNFADCTPIILYDTSNNIAAGLHAGWRGTAEEICKKAVNIMKKEFRSNPDKIIAAIGPCIAKEDFETGEEVYKALKQTIKNDDKLFDFNNNKFYPDLAKINACQLKEEGIQTIDICQFKTTTDNEFFFSYRKNNKTTNRISMVLKII